jgi:hypothetical protein
MHSLTRILLSALCLTLSACDSSTSPASPTPPTAAPPLPPRPEPPTSTKTNNNPQQQPPKTTPKPTPQRRDNTPKEALGLPLPPDAQIKITESYEVSYLTGASVSEIQALLSPHLPSHTPTHFPKKGGLRLSPPNEDGVEVSITPRSTTQRLVTYALVYPPEAFLQEQAQIQQQQELHALGLGPAPIALPSDSVLSAPDPIDTTPPPDAEPPSDPLLNPPASRKPLKKLLIPASATRPRLWHSRCTLNPCPSKHPRWV